MKHVTLFIFSTLLLCTYPTQGMHQEIHLSYPLHEIEKRIVLDKIAKLTKETALDMIEPKKEHEGITYESECFPTQTKIYKNRTDNFALSILDTIAAQEKEHRYIPENTFKKENGIEYLILRTNYFGNYSRYWHKKDDKGEYILLHSIFTCKPRLLEVVNSYENDILSKKSLSQKKDEYV